MAWSRTSSWSRLAIPSLLLVASLTFGTSAGQQAYAGSVSQANSGVGPSGAGGYAGAGSYSGNQQWGPLQNGGSKWRNGEWGNYPPGKNVKPVAKKRKIQSYVSNNGLYDQSPNVPATGPYVSTPTVSWPPVGGYTTVFQYGVTMFTRCMARSKTELAQNRIQSYYIQYQSIGYSVNNMFVIVVALYKEISLNYPDMSCVEVAMQTTIEMVYFMVTVVKGSNYGCLFELAYSFDYVTAFSYVMNYFGWDMLSFTNYFLSMSSIWG